MAGERPVAYKAGTDVGAVGAGSAATAGGRDRTGAGLRTVGVCDLG